LSVYYDIIKVSTIAFTYKNKKTGFSTKAQTMLLSLQAVILPYIGIFPYLFF